MSASSPRRARLGREAKPAPVRHPWFAALSILYTLPLALLATAGALHFDLPPTPALLVTFLPFLYLPLALALPLAIWSRVRIAQASALAALVVFGTSYGPLFLPRIGPPPGDGGKAMTAMSFNVSWLPAEEEMLEAIRRVDADVVVLLEMSHSKARLLDRALPERYPYRIVDSRAHTTGLLSRFPIVETTWFQPGESGRAALRAILNWDGQALAVYATHPSPPDFLYFRGAPVPIGQEDPWRVEQVGEVANRAAAEDIPTLIMGDFNMTDRHPAYGVVRDAGFGDAFREAGQGFGFTWPQNVGLFGQPVPFRAIRIDYIFDSQDFAVRWAQVGCDGGSDHCHVSAQLVLR